jgi:hypothetical protein
LNDIEFQSSTIIDEIKVLLDNIQHYKVHFLSGTDISQAFKNMDNRMQVKYNQTLEETCGLLMEIPPIILLDFYKYYDKFISVLPPTEERLKKKEIKNEEHCFHANARLLADTSMFVKCCFEVYTLLVKQVDDLIVPNKTFYKLIGYIERCRYNVSNLIMMSKNALKNMINDLKIIYKHQIVLDGTRPYQKMSEADSGDESYITTNSKTKKNVHKSLGRDNSQMSYRQGTDLTDKMKKQFAFKLNEDNQRMIRLNNVLTKKRANIDESFEKKRREVREKFISKSILVRYIFNMSNIIIEFRFNDTFT